MRYFSRYKNEYGEFIIVDEESKITNLALSAYAVIGEDMLERETKVLLQAKRELTEFFLGRRKHFDVPLKARGSEFQEKVWQSLREIPYGETYTYGQVAHLIGNAKAARAVGMANHRNPILFMIPCHRVIGAQGKLVGYAGGLALKEKLLLLEKKHKESV